MGELKSAAHTRYSLWYHIVWIVKYRKELISGKARRDKLVEILRGIGERYWFEIERVGIEGNHVHVFMGAAPRYSPAHVVKILKSISAREMFRAFPEMQDQLWGGELWGDGYFVRSVGDKVTEEVIRKYIDRHNQEVGRTPEQLELF